MTDLKVAKQLQYKLAFLGTGTSNSTKENPASFVITNGHSLIAVDFGGGAYHQLSRLNDNRFTHDKLDYLFLTHFHLDHISGIPDLIWGEMWSTISPREKVLKIVGAPGLKETWEKRILPMIDREITFPIELIEINGDLFTTDKGIMVEITETDHTSSSIAYTFSINSKKISFTGDTAINENIIRLINNSDITITECSFTNDRTDPMKHMNITSIKKLIAKTNNRSDLYFTHIYPEPGMSHNEQIQKIKKTVGKKQNLCYFPNDLTILDI